MNMKEIKNIKNNNSSTHLKLFEVAKKAYKDGHLVVVIEFLAPYTKKNPSHAYAWYLLGDAFRRIGRFKDAKKAIFKALDLKDNEGITPTKSIIAKLFDDMGCYSEALKWYEEIELDRDYSNYGWFWILKGCCFSKLNNFLEAEKCFRKSLEFKDGNVDLDEAYINLGYVLRAQGKYEESKIAFQEANKISPNNSDILEALTTLKGFKNK